MKKNGLLLLCIIMFALIKGTYAQNSITFSFFSQFACENANLDSVVIENLTRGGDTVIYYPENQLTFLLEGVGINEFSNNQKSFQVSQNYPNPFSGDTYFDINVIENDYFSIEIYNFYGQCISSFQKNLNAGLHSFKFIAGNDNSYILKISNKEYSKSIYMLNVGNTNSTIPGLIYNNTSLKEVFEKSGTKKSKSINEIPFNFGDQLRFTGYTGGHSSTITDTPTQDKSYNFLIDSSVLAAPTAIQASSISCSHFSANWNAVENAEEYFIDLSYNSSFTSFVTGYYNFNIGNVTTYFIQGLNANTTYYYRVRAKNSCGNSTNSNVVSQLTNNVTPSPVANNALVSCENFTANWDAVTGANEYFLDVATDAGFTSMLAGFNNLNVGNVTTYNITGLTNNVTYYYRLRANAFCGLSDNSNVISATTGPPDGPIANNAMNLQAVSFTAFWSSNGAASYYLDVATDAAFTSFVPGYNNLQTANFCVVSGLSPNTTYYYRVRAFNGCLSNNSNVITVTTLGSGQYYYNPGTFTWTCPAGVTSVNVVCVGAGGGGANGDGYGGGGGELRWKNNITVVPGNTYQVIVGDYGISAGSSNSDENGTDGGFSSFNISTVVANGGTGGTHSTYGLGGSGGIGDGGGNGGNGGNSACSGGGGAGGYSGNGGNGGTNGGGASGAGTGGAASGGAGGNLGTEKYCEGGTSRTAGGGGGTGIFGEGANGASVSGYAGDCTNGTGGAAGLSGSGGWNGQMGYENAGGPGGWRAGGGGGAGSVDLNGPYTHLGAGWGGSGAVSIMW